MTTDLIALARTGDEEAFRQLVGPHRRELLVHCYRFLGSMQDAEDTLQETLLAAWQGLAGFEARASVRTWLYRVATNRCLNALRAGGRRPRMSEPPAGFEPPEANRRGEVLWLEPCPDNLLDGLTDAAPGPEARYEAKESISLAFVTAVQLLPPRQRAVLILRDVLGFRASEVAEFLESTEESVTSALKRARATLQHRLPPPGTPPPPPPDSAAEQELIRRLTHAFQVRDVDGVVALLTDDVWLSMPPLPLEYHGRELAARFHATVTFRPGRDVRLVPAARANGQPAFGLYSRDPQANVMRATGLLVLTLAGDRISAMTAFESGVLLRFGLPRILPD